MTIEKNTLNGVRVENVEYLGTSRGVAYTAILFIDDKEVGTVENQGNGGPTSIIIGDKTARKEFNVRMNEYFSEVKVHPIEAESDFAEHLFDMHDFGKVLSEKEKIELLQVNG